MFPAPEGGRANINNWRNREWTPALAAAGVQHRRIYDLRHTYATWSLAAGVYIFTLARRMGTSVKMIDRTYGHLVAGADVYERDLLDAFDRAKYLRLYTEAGARYGIDPWILAAIGWIETQHGRSTAPGVRSGVNAYGCCAGPMQFNIRNGSPSTLDSFRADGNHDGRRSPYDPSDAIPAAAKYPRATGAPGDYRTALFAYNHAEWYVAQVLTKAAAYRGAPRAGGDLAIDPATVRELLGNPRIVLTPVQRADLQAGGIDPRLIATLAAIGRRHTVVITALQSDHQPGTNHEAGRAMDIGTVDGEPCNGQRTGACAQLVREPAAVEGPLSSTELIYCWDPDGPADPRGFARADHCDHIHWGLDG